MTETQQNLIDLVNQAKSLRNEIVSQEPLIDRSIAQLANSKIGLRSYDSAVDNSKAALVLGSKGFDVPAVSQMIETIEFDKLFKPVEEETLAADPELSIRKYHERTVRKIIEESEKNTIALIEENFMKRISENWEKRKQDIIELMEVSLSAPDPKLSITPKEESLTMTYKINPKDKLDDMEIFFAKVIHDYVKGKVNHCWSKNLIEEFADVCGLTDNSNIVELWKIFKGVTSFSDSSHVSQLNVQSPTASFNCLKLIVKQARVFLEKEFRKHVTDTVYADLATASLGGVPGIYPLVRAYLSVLGVQRNNETCHLYDDGAIEDKPAWMFLYYCLRCGDVKAAIAAAEAAQLSDVIQILHELRTSADNQVSPERRDRIKSIYKRSIIRSYDPYKKIVYCILGHCDPGENHSQVADNIEDFLWLKLFQVEFEHSESPDSLFIYDFQKEISSVLGEKYFLSDDQSPYVYLQCLLITGQFEIALELMCRYQHLIPHAVHMAIALQQLSLLHLPSNLLVPLLSSSDSPEVMNFNIHKLIRTYVKRFGLQNSEAVFDYFYLLADCRDASGQNCFAVEISDYVKKYGIIDEAFGKMNSDGIRSHGLIDNYTDTPSEIIDFVAADFENNGKFIQAVRLYHLADDHERMIILLTQLLSTLLCASESKELKRKDILILATEIYERIMKVGHNSPNNDAVRHMLLILDLANFFDMYSNGKYERAVECIKQLPILPFTVDTVEQKIKDYSSLPSQVKYNIGEIIGTTAQCLSKLYEMSKPKDSASGVKVFADISAFTSSIKEQANALIQYAGSIPFNIHSSTNIKLIHLGTITRT